MSFRICIDLDAYETRGLDALDFRRSKKLPDNDEVAVSASAELYCDVDEAFARAWFRPDARTERADITVEMLAPGDLIEAGNPTLITFSREMTTERAKELFIAGRFRALKSK